MKPGFLNEVAQETLQNESFKAEKFEKQEKKKPNLILIAVLVLGVSIGAWFYFNQSSVVPDFNTWALSDVDAWSSSNDVQLVYKGVYSSQAVDTIVSQDVVPGTKLSSNGVLVVEVSMGVDPDELISIPAFDQTWDKTKLVSWLSEMQIDDFNFTLIDDSNFAPNAFIALTTSAITVDDFKRSDSIVFTVNAPLVPSTLVMIDLSAMTLEEVQAWASESFVALKVNSAFSSLVPSDKVLSQSIEANTLVEENSELLVTFSKGEAVVLTDFRTLDSSEAKIWASENNILLTVETIYSSVDQGALISQSIKSGTSLEMKSKITLVYSLGNDITIGSYVNASITSFKSFIEAQNLLGAQLKTIITYQYSSSVAVNKIIAINISDEEISRGSTIELVLSLGALVKVPDFVSLGSSDYVSTYNAILNAAKTANVTIRITSIDDPDVNGDFIITQSTVATSACSSIDIIDVTITY